MRSFILCLCILFSCVLTCSAQYFHYDTIPPTNAVQDPVVTQQAQQLQPEPALKSRFDARKVVIGGSFGLSFGTYYTALTLAPQVGYSLNRFMTAGVGVSYSYYNIWGDRQGETQNYLGMNAYLRLTPVRYIAFQVQPEVYRLWGNNLRSQTVPCCLLGIGTVYPAGRGGVSAMIYYDVVQDRWSPYGNRPFYSVGYIFNF